MTARQPRRASLRPRARYTAFDRERNARLSPATRKMLDAAIRGGYMGHGIGRRDPRTGE